MPSHLKQAEIKLPKLHKNWRAADKREVKRNCSHNLSFGTRLQCWNILCFFLRLKSFWGAQRLSKFFRYWTLKNLLSLFASKDEFACLAKSWKRKTIFFETEIGRLYIHFSTPIILSWCIIEDIVWVFKFFPNFTRGKIRLEGHWVATHLIFNQIVPF